MTLETFIKIQKLLGQRETLTEMSIVLYGDLFVDSAEFWGSVTERQMNDVVDELIELGYVESYDALIRNQADEIFRRFFGDLPNKNLDM